MNKIVIGRWINGCMLNGEEFLLDPTNDYMKFDSIEDAKDFIVENTDCPMVLIDEHFNFYEVDNKGIIIK